MTTDKDFMKFMENEYNAKFVDAKVDVDHSKQGLPKEPPPLPQAWVGLYNGHKRDAYYYERCLRSYRDLWIQTIGMAKGAPPDDGTARHVEELAQNQIQHLDQILAHEYELDGVDLDKPNYGMF